MKVFVGFGYNDNDKWIKELIIPFIEVLGCEVVTGEEIQGEKLSDGVKAKVKECDACIGFLTKRGAANANGIFSTHWWVIEEMAVAFASNIRVFPIREKGIDPQNGINGDVQRYEFEDRTLLMLEITKFVMKEKAQLAYKTFMLLPQEFSDAIKPNLKFAQCTYKFYYKGKYYEPEKTSIVRMQGGYGIIIRKIPNEEASVEINIEFPGGNTWNSGFVSVGLINIELIKES
jgi:hypothetical protein